jgi:hypothetical protein
MSGRPRLQHSNITWYVIQKRNNEIVKSIVEDLPDPEIIESEFEPLELSTDNVDVFILNAQIKKTLKNSLTSSPANDIIKDTPKRKGDKK